jgi:hypothetical protein
MAEVDVRAGGVHAKLHAQRPPGFELLGKRSRGQRVDRAGEQPLERSGIAGPGGSHPGQC